MKRVIALLTTSLVLAAIAACGDDEPKGGNGVNSVVAACEIRTKWVRSGNNCSVCESAVVSERCECEALKDFSGACLAQANERKSKCTDPNTDLCVFNCDAADCACIEKCYESAPPGCRAASDARDGCIAAQCESHCH